MPAKATLCASSAADRAFTKSKSDTAASVLALLELSEEPGLLPACYLNAAAAAALAWCVRLRFGYLTQPLSGVT
jgi:hypothetical protein